METKDLLIYTTKLEALLSEAIVKFVVGNTEEQLDWMKRVVKTMGKRKERR